MKHRNKAIVLALLLVGLFTPHSPSAQAQTPLIDSLFATAPTSELPLLEFNSRLDMLDLYNYKMTAKGETLFGKYAYLENKSEQSLFIRLTGASTWQLMRLQAPGFPEKLLCLHSLTGSVAQTTVRLYDNAWQRDTATILPTFRLNDFINTTDSIDDDTMADIQRLLSVRHLVVAGEEATASRSVIRVSIPTLHLGLENRTRLVPLLHDLLLTWDGRRFDRPQAVARKEEPQKF
ncbi:MAG: DUF3256 family protein [Alloprevotella sp.]